jgi:hypothetical protein
VTRARRFHVSSGLPAKMASPATMGSSSSGRSTAAGSGVALGAAAVEALALVGGASMGRSWGSLAQPTASASDEVTRAARARHDEEAEGTRHKRARASKRARDPRETDRMRAG